MAQIAASPERLLKASYEELGYSEGELFGATSSPEGISSEDWLNKGEWLALAKTIDAEKIFFLNNNPVVVFARHDSDDTAALRKLYNNIWCMGRPRLLFLAKPGEIAVYDLANKPSRTDVEWKESKALAIAKNAEQVASRLKKFHREQLESGRLFENSEIRFGDIKNRADKALISDLKVIRQELINKGLSGTKVKYAHALIGRSIFIRYLEDRDILIPDDFYDVAEGNPGWERLLDEEPDYLGLDCSETTSLYPRVLENKDFTFALFRKLAEDFNGDMFPDIEQEEKAIKQTHLHLMRDLLYGDTGPQKNLFFYAYQFKVIPIELISSIYDEFYHKESGSQSKTKKTQTKANPQGAYYTPPALVEFLLSKVLTHQNLEKNPRILDPACGSGIFLVESFRRIVRYRVLKQGRRLRFDELRKILRDQLAGIDIEIEAIRVAAFSLYLALLHYLDPPSIREQIKMGNRLPYLVIEEGKSKPNNFNTFLAANAFDDKLIESNPSLMKSFSSCCADIVVGNPPWGAPSTKDKDAFATNRMALDWCVKKNKPTGKKERSQVFIWKALDALKPNGISALLVHMNVFLMHHDNSVNFRSTWFSEARLHYVFNFSHTRKVFFKGAIAPFSAILFSPKESNQKECQVEYWSAKNTKTINNLQSVIFRRNDLKILRAGQDLADHRTWKLYWWGNHHDENLINHIKRNYMLKVFSPDGFHCRGFEAGHQYNSDWLEEYKFIPTPSIQRYGNIDLTKLEKISDKVNRRGNKDLYHGLRLLIKRGIQQKGTQKGQVVARLDNNDFAFMNSVYGIKLKNDKQWIYKCILGILWSSLAKYYLLLTSYDWGVWHDEIRFEDELLELPICLPKNKYLRNRIVHIVDKLRTYDPIVEVKDIFQPGGVPEEEIEAKRRELELQLDDAIFELYELNEAEKDLIKDMCKYGLDMFYNNIKSDAVEPVEIDQDGKTCGVLGDIRGGANEITEYIRTFLKIWNRELAPGGEFSWRIIYPGRNIPMIGVVFSTKDKKEPLEIEEGLDVDQWKGVLEKLDKNSLTPFGSRRIYIDGIVRAVSDTDIMIIKRNERRLWTRSMAREDAEATLLQAINLQELKRG